MQQRDLIKDQIDQLGKVFGKGIARILGLDNNDDIVSVLEEVEKELNKELNIDLKEWLNLDQAAYEHALKDRLNNHEQPLELLGNLLFEMGKSCGPEGLLRMQYLEKALWTYTYLHQQSATFSMSRLAIINAIRKEING